MPSDALAVPSDNGGEPEPGLLPPGVRFAPEVDVDSADPALTADGRRLCVAAAKAGGRCNAPAIRTLLVCSFHSGRLDPAAGGKAKAEKLRLVAEEAQNREIQARLGTRAIVASALAEKHAEIRLAIHELADRAADGDRQCALALLPYMTQALGTPSPAGATLLPTPEGEELDLSTLNTAQLRALLTPTPSE